MAIAIQTSKQPWLRRPSGVVQIDWSSYHSVGLVLCVSNWLSGDVRDLVSMRRLTNTNALVSQGDALGGTAGRFQTGAASYYIGLPPPVETVPITMTAWANIENATANHVIVCLSNASADNHYQSLFAAGGVAGDYLSVASRGGGAEYGASAGTYPVNEWFHGAAVVGSATSRKAYLNGVPGTEGTTSVTTTITNVGIGGLTRLNKIAFTQGRIADVRIYNRALDAAEVAALYNPRTRWELYAG